MAVNDTTNTTTADRKATRTTDAKGTPSAKPRRKRRWWLRILIGLPLLLIVLVALGPTLLSTGLFRQAIVRAVNDNIRGTVAVDDISLGWFSSAKITGLHVTDPMHPETLTIGGVTWDKGIFGALSMLRSSDGINLGRLDIDTIEGVIYFNPDGTNSLQNALAPRQTSALPTPTPYDPPQDRPTQDPPPDSPAPTPDSPSPSAAATKPFNLQARLAVTNSRLSLVQFDGRTVNVTDLNTVVDVDYPKGLTVTHTSTHDGGGKLRAEVTLQNLPTSADGLATLFETLSGTVKIHTEPAIDLGPAVTFFAPPSTRGRGSLNLDIDGQFASGAASGKYLVTVGDLSLADDAIEVNAVTQEFAGEMTYKDSHVSVENKSTGTIGTIASRVVYNTAGPALSENLVDLLMQGKSFIAPDVALTMNGKVDLGALARALPGIVKLQEGVEIENGTLVLKGITVQGGQSPTTDGEVTLTVAIQRDGKITPIQPVVLNWCVLTNSKGQLQIGDFAGVDDSFTTTGRIRGTGVTSSFATANVRGTVDTLGASFTADLTLLRQELAKLVDLKDLELGGKVDGSLSIATDTADARLHTLDLHVRANDVVVASSTPAEPADEAAPPPAAEPKAGNPATDDGPTRISGTLVWKAGLRYASRKFDLKGKMDLAGLKLSPVGDMLGGDAPTLEHDLALDMKNQRLDVRAFSLVSQVLKISDFTGSVTQLSGDMVLDLAGSYDADWKELTALAERFKPGAMEGIAMRANSAGPIAITGPAGAPTITPLRGNTRVGWGKQSVVYGIDFGDAKLEPKIADGVFALPLAEIPANDGTLRLMSHVTLTGDEPVLTIPGQLQMMDRIAVNADMGKYLLSRAVPLLAETTRLEGMVSLMVRDIDLPLGDSMMTSGSGSGRLDLSEIRLSPAGEIARLFTLVGLDASKSYPVTIGAVDFQLRNGALVYDNMTVAVGGMELRVRGQVRFDDGVDLIVSVPVKREMLEAVGIKGSTLARIPDGLRVDVPLVGTRTKPKLDLGSIDKETLARDVAGEVLKGVGVDLGGLLGGGSATTQPADSSEKKTPALPIKLPTSLPSLFGR